MTKLPLEAQTLYAELLERLLAAEAGRAIGDVPGTFVTKTVKGETYYYFQHSEPGGGRRQVYIGPRDDTLDRVVERYRTASADRREDDAAVRRLCSALRASGALTTDTASARVLAALAKSGVFHLGGVLVGTQAFTALGNLLGVRWERAALRTFDLDLASEAAMAIAVPDLHADLPAALDALQMGFLPVPPLNPRHPSTAFKVRGHPLRVDLLTPARRTTQSTPVPIPRLNAAAQPLPHLELLLERPERAAVIDGGGVLVNVPAPVRFALHKLLTARLRPVSTHAKIEKDLAQAGQMLALLADERPEDLRLEWERLAARPSLRAHIRRGLALLARRQPDLAAQVGAIVA